MISYTGLYTRAATMCGISTTTDAVDLANIQTDLNTGLSLFKNSARRYWTRVEQQTNLVAGQQYYSYPPNAVRITEVRVNSNGLNFPLIKVDSEHLWNKLNIIPAMTINLPTYYFVKGFNEIGLWPTPSANTVNGLLISYEPRINLSIEDFTTGTVSLTNGTTTVTNSGSNFIPSMVGRWFQITDGTTDGQWYQVASYDSATAIELANDYAGTSTTTGAYIISQMPDIPEDYHLGLVYYACYNFFLKRKDAGTASNYFAMYEDLLNRYKDTYASKSTGLVLDNVEDYRYSLFSIPPNPIS